jgi:cytochrome c556
MTKGEKPFDAAVVLDALQSINNHAQKLDVATLFPAGTDQGDTEASPKIWEDMAGFQAKVDKFRTDAAAAVAAPPQDVEALKATLGAVGSNCGGCHETFRIKKS